MYNDVLLFKIIKDLEIKFRNKNMYILTCIDNKCFKVFDFITENIIFKCKSMNELEKFINSEEN